MTSIEWLLIFTLVLLILLLFLSNLNLKNLAKSQLELIKVINLSQERNLTQISSTFSNNIEDLTGLLDKTVALASASDIGSYQGIQAMNAPAGEYVEDDSDANLSDDELAFKQAKERGELTPDEYAYFEYKGFDVQGIAISAG